MYNKIIKPVKNQIETNHTDQQIQQFIDNQMYSYVWIQIDNNVYSQVHTQVYIRVWFKIWNR